MSSKKIKNVVGTFDTDPAPILNMPELIFLKVVNKERLLILD